MRAQMNAAAIEHAIDMQQFSSAAELAEAVAHEVAQQLRAAISQRGEASLVVSGGKSPVDMFRHLSEQALDWDKVTVTLADERWVPPEDPDSNESLVRKHLLVNAAAAARFVPLKTQAERPEEAMDEVTSAIASIKRPFDLVLLGLGPDGHTASWFPDSPAIRHCLSSQRLCYAIQSPVARIPRVTLTPAAILDARLIMLVFSGSQKKDMFDLAELPGETAALPVRAVLRQTAVPLAVRYSAS